jgi:N-acetylmuramoyl-L-alanine amidase
MRYTFIVILLIVIYSCAQRPYQATNKAYRQQAKQYASVLRQQPGEIETVNFNLRKPNYVIIHHTAQQTCDSTFRTFTLVRTQVSAHYVICADGTVHHMLNDYMRAWHAGLSRWGGITDVNSVSIGIELDNDGFHPFQPQQINSLLVLLDTLKHKYNIPAANFIGHGDIAPTRKNDPSAYFPWQQLADKGFGLWYGDTSKIIVPENFNPYMALRIIGYDVRDTTAVMKAFKRHFAPADSTTGTNLDEGEKKMMISIMQKSE